MKKLLVLMILATITLCLLAVLIPSSRQYLFPENKLVEAITAGLYLIAFLTATIIAVKTKKHRITYVIIALLSVFAFLEELSYGEQAFNLKFDRVYGLDLSTAHNIIQLPYYFLKENSEILLNTFLIIASIKILAVTLLMYSQRTRINIFFEKIPPTRFLFIFFILAGTALVIDSGVAYHRFLPYIEEILELNASIALLFGAIPLNITTKANKL